ncbi:hypothetical protein UFOVP589_7 [uncultured Caudovirales phage]|uniref:Uncharacterized protein n=1 Tax=uncultured Caudovirales phage TaxID=2100421 RepID=A0A6J5MXZ9_9CAUD|nr:hypothetical protein UFOVP589_7 [uncultured Caudovirales phage]
MEIRQKNSLPWSHHLAVGNMNQAHVHHQFGRNVLVGTTYSPISDTGLYRTPQPAAATALRIKAGGNAADTANGAGARSVKLWGMDANGDEITAIIATNGASASTATTVTFIRLYLAEVYETGTYGTATAGSHVGNITIENAAGTEDWAQIQLNGFPSGTTGIGSISVPRNHIGLITSIQINPEMAANKTTDVLILKREGILQTAAPYKPIVKIQEIIGLAATIGIGFDMPMVVPELTDIGVLAKVSGGTGAISVDMEVIFLEAESYP